MSEHPAMWLREAHACAEKLARAATQDPWTVHPYDWTTGFDASIGHNFEADVVGGGHEGGGVVDMADAEFIVANSPGTVLRRVAAERQILAGHQVTQGLGYVGCDYTEMDAVCTGCGTADEYGTPWPCRTVLLLAAGWGWTEAGS